jgi:hypothetical protein
MLKLLSALKQIANQLLGGLAIKMANVDASGSNIAEFGDDE